MLAEVVSAHVLLALRATGTGARAVVGKASDHLGQWFTLSTQQLSDLGSKCWERFRESWVQPMCHHGSIDVAGLRSTRGIEQAQLTPASVDQLQRRIALPEREIVDGQGELEEPTAEWEAALAANRKLTRALNQRP